MMTAPTPPNSRGRLSHRGVDPVHGRCRPGEDQLEEEHHHGREQQGSGQRVEHHAIDGIGDAMCPGAVGHDARQDRLGPGRALLDVLRRRQVGAAPVLGSGQQPSQLAEAQALVAHHAAHGDAEGALEMREVEYPSACPQLVGHRQH
jgi:hypothetical protein